MLAYVGRATQEQVPHVRAIALRQGQRHPELFRERILAGSFARSFRGQNS